jgi:hypothetical protein
MDELKPALSQKWIAHYMITLYRTIPPATNPASSHQNRGKLSNPNPTNHLHRINNMPISFLPLAKIE